MELTPNEILIIQEMRKYGPYAQFMVEKKPTSEKPNGELVRIESTIKTKFA